MPSAFIGRAEKGAENVERHFLADDTGTDGKNIGVIMGAGEARGRHIMREAAAYRRVAIRGNRHADAGTTDKNPEISLRLGDSGADSLGEIRVIDTRRAVRTEIQHLMAAFNEEGG